VQSFRVRGRADEVGKGKQTKEARLSVVSLEALLGRVQRAGGGQTEKMEFGCCLKEGHSRRSAVGHNVSARCENGTGTVGRAVGCRVWSVEEGQGKMSTARKSGTKRKRRRGLGSRHPDSAAADWAWGEAPREAPTAHARQGRRGLAVGPDQTPNACWRREGVEGQPQNRGRDGLKMHPISWDA